jgi:hypothetical protein
MIELFAPVKPKSFRRYMARVGVTTIEQAFHVVAQVNHQDLDYEASVIS